MVPASLLPLNGVWPLPSPSEWSCLNVHLVILGSRTSHQPFLVIFSFQKHFTPPHLCLSVALKASVVLMRCWCFFFFKCFSAGLDNWHSLSFFCLFSAWNIKEPWSSFLSSLPQCGLTPFPLSPPISPTSLLSLKLPACPDIILLRPFRIFRGKWLDWLR